MPRKLGKMKQVPLSAQPHLLCKAFPPMQEDEYLRLVADIRKHGVLEPVMMFDGEVLDGWHRVRACREIGVRCPMVEYAGADPLAYVIGRNAHRRHLTKGQVAMILAPDLWDSLREETRQRRAERAAGMSTRRWHGGKDPAAGKRHRKIGEVIGERLGMGSTLVNKAIAIHKRPELAAAVLRGDMTIEEAESATRGVDADLIKLYNLLRVSLSTMKQARTAAGRIPEAGRGREFEWFTRNLQTELKRADAKLRPMYQKIPSLQSPDSPRRLVRVNTRKVDHADSDD